jgi:hypothetical protein
MQVVRASIPSARERAALALYGIRDAVGPLTAVLDARHPPAPEHLLRAAAEHVADGEVGAVADVDELVVASRGAAAGRAWLRTGAFARRAGWDAPDDRVVPSTASTPHRSVWVCVRAAPGGRAAEQLGRLVLARLARAGVEGHALLVDTAAAPGMGTVVVRPDPQEPRLHTLYCDPAAGRAGADLCALRCALERGADVVVQMDGDFSHDPSSVPVLVAAVSGADLVVGGRDAFRCFRRAALESLLGGPRAGGEAIADLTACAQAAGHVVLEVRLTRRAAVPARSSSPLLADALGVARGALETCLPGPVRRLGRRSGRSRPVPRLAAGSANGDGEATGSPLAASSAGAPPR